MPRTRVLTLVMAGGAGSRMGALTEARAKPALPLAGVYKLIDIPLSNCVNSELSDVWVIEQYQPHALNDHLANGRPWDLDRTYGGLRVMPPYQGAGESGWHQGNADAIFHHRRLIAEFAPEVVLVVSADHLYRLDYRDLLDAHLEQDADVTIVSTRVPREQAGRFGNLQVGPQGRVTGFAYKPDQPLGETVTAEVFAYKAERLLALINELAEGMGDGEESGLKDFGHQLIPALVEQGKAYAFPLDGYWRDLGTIGSYWLAHMDLLRPEPPIRLDDPAWPMRTYGIQRLPARVEATARITGSMVAAGCQVRGQVENSILGPGVVVEEGATVRESILFEDARIGAGATVERAIVERRVQVTPGQRLGRPGQAREEGEGLDREITVVGKEDGTLQ